MILHQPTAGDALFAKDAAQPLRSLSGLAAHVGGAAIIAKLGEGITRIGMDLLLAGFERAFGVGLTFRRSREKRSRVHLIAGMLTSAP